MYYYCDVMYNMWAPPTIVLCPSLSWDDEDVEEEEELHLCVDFTPLWADVSQRALAAHGSSCGSIRGL